MDILTVEGHDDGLGLRGYICRHNVGGFRVSTPALSVLSTVLEAVDTPTRDLIGDSDLGAQSRNKSCPDSCVFTLIPL